MSSVIRTVSEDSACVEPSGKRSRADVPGANSSAPWRGPASSVSTLPSAAAGSVSASRSTTVALGLATLNITSAAWAMCCIGASTARCARMKPAAWRSSVSRWLALTARM
ncbi:MAG: hypothetical protein IPG04_35385 [Polyangiaceae bacterium]|nr:hypothetical protein [Polyangiaceae bacterium]